jgi:hypothetical protein
MSTVIVRVEIVDRDGRSVELRYAHGNTLLAAMSAAGALGRTMTHQHEDNPNGPVVMKIGKPVRRATPEGPEDDLGGLIGQQPY